MTAIANWINKESTDYHSIWSIGDSKVTDKNSGTTLTLENSKVLENPISVIDLSSHPEKRFKYFNHSIGFSYAGSTLIGLNCFATLSTMLLNLGGINGVIPDLKNISSLASKVIDYYSKSISNLYNPFEAIIYGYCHFNKRLERYSISKKEINGELFYVPDNISEETIFLLGDKKTEILEQINNNQKLILDKNSQDYWRSPLKTLSNITTSNLYESIGGGTQLNIANQFGCNPYQAVGEREDSSMKFRNIDIDLDIGSQLGDSLVRISIPGLYYNFKNEKKN